MIALRWAEGLHPALERVARRITGVLDGWGLVTADEAAARAVLALGAGDPAVLAGGVDRPLVVMPLLGPGPAGPWCAPTLARAGALALLSPAEAADLRPHTRAPAVVVGLPAPAGPAPAPRPVAGRALAALGAPGAARVAALAGGRGACAAADALEAWRAGLPVVAAPGAGADPVLAQGGALRCRGVLEAAEAALVLAALPPLARTLPGAGRRAMRRLPSVEAVAGRLLEAVELAS